jgi:DNA-binding transcriptional MerR regulator
MRYLKTNEAATLLNVSANTLRSWEERFGFPNPQRSKGLHRTYLHAEVAALHDALQDGLSMASAVVRARRGLADHGNSLVGALLSYDRDRADAAIETTLKLRSVENSVEEVLLPALEEIARRCKVDSAAWAFAAPWGADWLRRAQLLAPPLERPVSIMLGNASRDELDPDFAYIRAFELFCVRAGIHVMSLSAGAALGIGDAIAAHGPDLVVLAGRQLADDAVAKWTHHVRLAVGPMPIVGYRRGDERMRMPTRGIIMLPSGASEAQRRLLELVDTEHAVRPAAASPAARYAGISL